MTEVMESRAEQKKFKKQQKKRLLRKYRVLYLFVLPGVVLLFLFNYLPMVGLSMTFQDYDPIKGFFQSTFVGLDNFKELFRTPNIAKATVNTLLISSMKLVVTFPAPIIFALLLNELTQLRFKKTVQTITYFPYFVSWVIVAGIWYKMLSPYDGIVNELLLRFNIVAEPISFMQSKLWFYPILILTDIWKNLGFSAIIYLSAMAGINQDQYEAATIDGAGRFKQAIHVTLPSIKPTIVLLFIMALSGLLNAGFDQLWTMGNMAVREIAEVLDTLVLRYLSTGTIHELSVGAALGFFKSAIGLLLFIIANYTCKKLTDSSLV